MRASWPFKVSEGHRLSYQLKAHELSDSLRPKRYLLAPFLRYRNRNRYAKTKAEVDEISSVGLRRGYTDTGQLMQLSTSVVKDSVTVTAKLTDLKKT